MAKKTLRNTVLMIRNPNAANVIYNQSTVTPKMKNNTILKTVMLYYLRLFL
jgi:hypothetical protein